MLERISLSVEAGGRLGVVGPNGIGKSTLLAVLAGQVTPESGVVARSPADLTVGYMTQEGDGCAGETLSAYLERKTGLAAAGRRLDLLTTRLAEDPSAVDDYSAALEQFLALGGDNFAARSASVLADLSLGEDRLAVAISDLSGGQQARARLAAIVLSRFDVLLLDEPTNDLDFAGLVQLEEFLDGFAGVVVCVSHDRAFLDRAVSRILEIEEHTHTATEYAGAWSEYVERKALGRRHAKEAYEQWSGERDRLRARVREQRGWSVQGVNREKRHPRDPDKAQRDFRINKTEKQASKVRISEKALERLGTMDKPWEGWELQLDLSAADRSGDVVWRASGAVAERGDFRLGPVDLEVAWGERLAVTGPNGSGKSTLIALLSGEIQPAQGTVYIGPSVRVGRLDQSRTPLLGTPARPLVSSFMEASGLALSEARSTLAKFGLGAAHASRSWEGLSPGERTRAHLALLMVRRVNCLILDEPTNHLDLPAIEQIEQAVEGFGGTLVVVTHDRWLLDNLRVDRHLEVQTGTVREGTSQTFGTHSEGIGQ